MRFCDESKPLRLLNCNLNCLIVLFVLFRIFLQIITLLTKFCWWFDRIVINGVVNSWGNKRFKFSGIVRCTIFELVITNLAMQLSYFWALMFIWLDHLGAWYCGLVAYARFDSRLTFMLCLPTSDIVIRNTYSSLTPTSTSFYFLVINLFPNPWN